MGQGGTLTMATARAPAKVEPMRGAMANERDLVVIGALAGGVEALRLLVATLTADLPAALLVVLHQSPTGPGALPQILSRAGPLPRTTAVHGMHLLVYRSATLLSSGPREHLHRP
jgi:two-component system chemotaxis response regulator CheB